MSGGNLVHVPFKGNAEVMNALLGGHIKIYFSLVPTVLQHVKAGTLRALAVTTEKRLPYLPDVPTIAEQGFAGFDAAPWWYVAAPAGTPPEIVQKLSDELVKASKSPDVIKRIRDAGASELGGSSEDLAKHMAAENIKWKKVIDAAKLEPQ